MHSAQVPPHKATPVQGEELAMPNFLPTRWPTDESQARETQGNTIATQGPDARRFSRQRRPETQVGTQGLACHQAWRATSRLGVLSSRCARGGSEVPTPHSIPDVGLSRADDPRRRTHLSADPAHELNNDRLEPLAILYFSQRPIPRKRRRQFCHKAGVQYLEDEALSLSMEASSFVRLFMGHGDWRRTSKPSRP